MKLKNFFNLIALGAALAISGTGCRHTPLGPTPIGSNGSRPKGPGPGAENNPDRSVGIPIPQNPRTVSDYGQNPPAYPLPPDHTGWNEDKGALSAQTVYFDYDKSAIKGSEQSKVDAVVSYLQSHPNAAVRVEGNCDERGTEEYNRSLGERRALAARERIVQAGIDPNRVESITYGKDKPVEMGHTEAAFSKNRRDEFVVLTAPGR